MSQSGGTNKYSPRVVGDRPAPVLPVSARAFCYTDFDAWPRLRSVILRSRHFQSISCCYYKLVHRTLLLGRGVGGVAVTGCLAAQVRTVVHGSARGLTTAKRRRRSGCSATHDANLDISSRSSTIEMRFFFSICSMNWRAYLSRPTSQCFFRLHAQRRSVAVSNPRWTVHSPSDGIRPSESVEPGCIYDHCPCKSADSGGFAPHRAAAPTSLRLHSSWKEWGEAGST